jgi:hypothetical protein
MLKRLSSIEITKKLINNLKHWLDYWIFTKIFDEVKVQTIINKFKLLETMVRNEGTIDSKSK